MAGTDSVILLRRQKLIVALHGLGHVSNDYYVLIRFLRRRMLLRMEVREKYDGNDTWKMWNLSTCRSGGAVVFGRRSCTAHWTFTYHLYLGFLQP